MDHSALRDTAYRLLLDGLVAHGSSARLEVTGRCMEPLIRHGDRVIISACREPVPGDIVVARIAGGEAVCHRVLRRSADSLLSAGDQSAITFSHDHNSLVGRVDGIERGEYTVHMGSGGNSVVERLLTGMHRLSVTWTGAGWPTARRALEATRRRLRAAWSGFTSREPRSPASLKFARVRARIGG